MRTLLELLGSNSKKISKYSPLGWLLFGTNADVKQVADYTDYCARSILKQNPQWIKSQFNKIAKEQEPENVSGMLGEVRAYGDLIKVWGESVRPGPKKGHDFSVKQGDSKLIIEVHTPQMTGKKHTKIHDTIERKLKGVNIQTQVSEIAPYGFPYNKEKDTFVGEAISTTAQIKCDEKQFSDEHERINILWLDYCDLFVWGFTLPEGVFTPIYPVLNSLLRSGHVWHAFYSPKGTVVYDYLPIEGGGYQKYEMEFDGRFVSRTKIDFVISRTANYTVVLENHLSEKKHSDSLYKDFFRLYDFKLDLAWMDWPVKRSLGARVKKALMEHRKYSKIFCIEA